MTYLDVRTAVTTVERALVEALSLAYQIRHEAAADLAELKGVISKGGSSNAIPNRALRYVQSEGVVYRWMTYSSNAEALPYVVLPADRAETSKGRWERQTSSVTVGPNYFRPVHRERTGYARLVQLWQGSEAEEGLNRIFGQSPAFTVRWTGDQLTTKGNQRALYEANLPFEVWCYARNYRQDWEALEGSPVASEAAVEPGLWRMMGDVRYLLAGTDLGLAPGIRYIDIQGQGQILHEDEAERRFVGIVPITVRAAYSIPDEDLAPLGEVWIQGQSVGMGYHILADQSLRARTTFDPANYVALGYQIFPSAGLSAAPTAGVAYLANQVVSSIPPPHTFTANMDTYRYLAPSGLMVYLEVAVDGPVPPVPAGHMLIGMTRTDGAGVINDALLCSYAMDRGESYRITP